MVESKSPAKSAFFSFGQSIRKFLPNKNEKKENATSFVSLFQYAKPREKFLSFIGLIGAMLSGLSLPIFIMLYSEFTTALIDRKTPNGTFHPTYVLPWFGGGRTILDGTPEDLSLAIKEDAQAYGIGALIVAVLDALVSFLCVSCLNYACVQQIKRIRRLLVRAVLEKDMPWYDVNNEGNFAVNLTEDLNNMQEGMGEKIGLFISRCCCFTACVVIALWSGWKLTLVVIACVPVMVLSQGLVAKLQSSMVVKEQKAYASASGVAEESFAMIKTVVAFGGQDKEVERYKAKLIDSQKMGVKRSLMSGIGSGILWFIIYSVYALAFWYGVTLILESRQNGDGENTPATIIIVMFGVVAGSMNMGQCMPYLEAFSIARGSATAIFNVMSAHSTINPFSKEGKKLEHVTGAIRFKNVHFSYPARSTVQILRGLDIDIVKGSKVALVGSSGCGKSTCVQLIQRLYDPNRGSVLLDDVDLRELNISWLRGQIGVVSQEPMLFATTIYENIKLGKITATKEEIETAAKMANAHDFISQLPNGYNTMIGQRGTQLSGGQKQRIAIARAVVRDPKILLLDEATSALDSSNEAAVQKALDRASKGRTTIVVAHRLSTVQNADKIVVISDGQFVESGTHDELIALKGEYYRLLNTQNSSLNASAADGAGKEAYEELALKDAVPEDEDSAMEVVEEEDDEEVIQKGETQQSASLFRILSYSKPEWFAILVGSLATIVVGSSCPIISILLGEIYGVISNPDPDEVRSGTDFYSGMMLTLGVSVGVAMFLQLYSFGYVASKLTSRLRSLTFSAILRMEPAWFDLDENKIGSLSAKLSGSAADIQAVAGSSLSLVLQSLTTMIIGFVIAFTYSWELTLVTSSTLPILFFGVYYEYSIVQGQNLLEKKTIEGASKVAIEAINGIRTVAGLGREETFVEKYCDELKAGEVVMIRKAFIRGVVYGVGQSATYLGYGASLWYGGYLVADDLMHYKDVIKVSEALLFGVWLLGQSLAFAPGYGKAKLSAGRLFQILDRQCALKDVSDSKENWQPTGDIKYSKVNFCYPNRPEAVILRELTLQIKPGTSVALAGSSGCGKSTIVQLLQRFYDPNDGVISFNSEDIREIPMAQLRNCMSIVSQEPLLFNLSIGENIAYGDNSRNVTQDEIIRAAKTANIHNFVVSLPSGYETNLGKGGTQLSGGQKQRIAIARALIRNPKILLLDEATSALDTASEAVVQAALDEASAGRTTITVGHRPASIAHADVIFVLDQGKVVEQGNYEKLLASNGFYASLNRH